MLPPCIHSSSVHDCSYHKDNPLCSSAFSLLVECKCFEVFYFRKKKCTLYSRVVVSIVPWGTIFPHSQNQNGCKGVCCSCPLYDSIQNSYPSKWMNFDQWDWVSACKLTIFVMIDMNFFSLNFHWRKKNIFTYLLILSRFVHGLFFFNRDVLFPPTLDILILLL